MPARHPHLLKAILASILFTLVATGSGSAAPWQLTVIYHEDGSLTLDGATLLPPIRKTLTSPSAAGALHEIPVEIAWLDSADAVLASTSAVLPLGTRVPVLEGAQESGVVLPEEVFVLRVPGPAAGSNPVRIRVTVQAPASAPAKSAAQSPSVTSPQFLTLPTAANRKSSPPPSPPPGPVSVTKVQDTGNDANRLVIVVVGDGYLDADIADGTYADDVDDTMAVFVNDSPWDTMMNATNIYSIAVSSNERGADYQDGAPGTGTLVDTYFNTAFHTSGIERLLTPDSTGRTRAFAAADAWVGAGVWDQVVVIVNSSKYGGAGGALATNSMHPSGPAISVHEVGHSFAGLADEYDYSDGATHTGGNPSQANADNSPTSPKWSIWIESGTPLPTPDTSTYNNTVGTFEGAKYKEFGLYRPWRSCTMRNLNAGFCPVCREKHLKTFFGIVSMTDSTSPPASTTVQVSSSETLTLAPLPIPGINYQWHRDGVPIPGETSAAISLSTSELPAPAQALMVEIDYVSTMMRSGEPSESYSWTIENIGTTTGGTPHWWLTSHSLDTSDATDLLDHDKDGRNARDEFLANTDPTDRNSAFKITQVVLSPSGDSGNLQWKTEPGRKYRLEESGNLADWNGVPGYTDITGDGSVVDYDPTGGAEMYYRVVVWVE